MHVKNKSINLLLRYYLASDTTSASPVEILFVIRIYPQGRLLCVDVKGQANLI